MALSAEQLAQVRKMIDEADATRGWTDVAINLVADRHIVDGVYDLRSTSGDIWETKAAQYVEAVNISESGSSRADAAMFDHAMAMAKQFGSTDPALLAANRPRSTRIVRPTSGG